MRVITLVGDTHDLDWRHMYVDGYKVLEGYAREIEMILRTLDLNYTTDIHEVAFGEHVIYAPELRHVLVTRG